MFAYCNNNPVLFADSLGFAPNSTTVAINDGGYSTNLVGRVGTYDELRKLTAGNPNYEVHHLVEKRFYNVPGIGKCKKTPNKAPCVILEKETHKGYTASARKLVQYGSNYTQVKVSVIKEFYLTEYGGRVDWLDFICSCFE